MPKGYIISRVDTVDSEAYHASQCQEAKALRERAARMQMVLVEGV